MATVLEIAVPSINHMYSLYLVYLLFSHFLFWFQGHNFGSGCASSWSLLTFVPVLGCCLFRSDKKVYKKTPDARLE